MVDHTHDERIVLTLDAGGSSFRFSALRALKSITESVVMPSHGDNLEACLAGIVEGFTQVRSRCPEPPAAISFAFPGPADYPNGVIGDLGNLPCFSGGVALGPMLADKFGIPVFINNDGDLFTYGESLAGFLPWVNCLLQETGSSRRYQNLLGLTLGTGFGGGIVCHSELLKGDNSIAGEVWLLSNKLHPDWNAEEGTSIRAVRRVYAEKSGIPFDQAPDPRQIFEIGSGRATGEKSAAVEAFRQLGEVAGHAMAQALTLLDGLAVIGGGLSGAWPLFLPALVAEMNSSYAGPSGKSCRRLASTVFNLEDQVQLLEFIKEESLEVTVPASSRKVKYNAAPRLGVGVSRLGASEAIAIGAYVFALRRLDQK